MLYKRSSLLGSWAIKLQQTSDLGIVPGHGSVSTMIRWIFQLECQSKFKSIQQTSFIGQSPVAQMNPWLLPLFSRAIWTAERWISQFPSVEPWSYGETSFVAKNNYVPWCPSMSIITLLQLSFFHLSLWFTPFLLVFSYDPRHNTSRMGTSLLKKTRSFGRNFDAPVFQLTKKSKVLDPHQFTPSLVQIKESRDASNSGALAISIAACAHNVAISWFSFSHMANTTEGNTMWIACYVAPTCQQKTLSARPVANSSAIHHYGPLEDEFGLNMVASMIVGETVPL